MYRFWPGCRPPYRQMFYQLCDVDLDEVREIVHENDGQVNRLIEDGMVGIFTGLRTLHLNETLCAIQDTHDMF